MATLISGGNCAPGTMTSPRSVYTPPDTDCPCYCHGDPEAHHEFEMAQRTRDFFFSMRPKNHARPRCMALGFLPTNAEQCGAILQARRTL